MIFGFESNRDPAENPSNSRPFPLAYLVPGMPHRTPIIARSPNASGSAKHAASPSCPASPPRVSGVVCFIGA